MSDPLRLTPGALESLLADREADAVVAFVADLYDRTEREATHQGRVVTVTGRGGENQRVLVWIDDRGRIERLVGGDPPEPDVDAVVAIRGGGGASVAANLDADLLETDDLHGRLLYAMDRDACRELCREHFDRRVDPQPAPEGGSEGITLGGLSRPRFALAAVVVCGLLVAGAAGLPGAGGPDKIPFIPGNETTTSGTLDPGPVTPVGGQGATAMVTPSPPPTDRTPTVGVGPQTTTNVTGSLGGGNATGVKTVFASFHNLGEEFPREGPLVSETLTDADGNFTLEVLTNETYNIFYYDGDFSRTQNRMNVTPKNGVPDVFAIERVTVNGSDVSLGSQTLPTGYDLNVSVVNETGNPIQGARVTYVHTENDSDGPARASLRRLPTNVNGLADVSRFTARDVAGLEVMGNVTVVVRPPFDGRFVDQTDTRTLTVTEDDQITVMLNESDEGPVGDETPAIATAQTVNCGELFANELGLNTSECTPGGTTTDTLGMGNRITVLFPPDVAADDAGPGTA